MSLVTQPAMEAFQSSSSARTFTHLREMPVHSQAPVFICPRLFLETLCFPGLAWPEGGPAE